MGLSLIMLLSLMSFHIYEPHKDWLGYIGWGIGFALTWCFGLASYCVTALLGWVGWQNLLGKQSLLRTSKIVYFSCFIVSLCLLLNLLAEADLAGAWWEKRVY